MDILDRIILLLGGRNQKELCDYLKLDKSAITSWKNGSSKSYHKYLIEIAKFFNVSIDYLVYGKETSSPEQLSVDQQELLNKYNALTEREQGRVLQFMEDLIAAHPSAYDTTEPMPSPNKAKPTAAMIEQKKHLA